MVCSRRSWWRLWLGLLAVSFLTVQTVAPSTASAQDEAAAAPVIDEVARQHWVDFCHYVRIAKPALAQAAGEALLGSVDDGQLLDIVEVGDYTDWEPILVRAGKTETLQEISEQLTKRIQAGRIARARDPLRIRRDIALLAEGPRANHNATERLRAAGEHAVPAMLATLLDSTQKRLHTYVLNALVAIGRPVVYPLSVALVDLEPVPQGQIAQVLAEIGYPRAAPYLKRVVEAESTDPDTRTIAAAAFAILADAAGLPEGISAAELFQTLAQNYYKAETEQMSLPGYSADQTSGHVWDYTPSTGLVAVPVPAQVFGSVLAMHAAQQALVMEPSRDPALSLLLMANLRRENNLQPDQADPSYPRNWPTPQFLLDAAGPLRQHDVLEQGLNDDDPALALDAIAALQATAGTDALINRGGAIQPLLRALSYPDRRVRFEAAIALTNARPTEPFPGSDGIVAVLAEALRQSDIRYAAVIGADQDSTNRIMAMLHDLGYEPIGGLSTLEISDAVVGKPGVDLIVTDQNVDQVQQFMQDRATDYKLSAVPVIVLASPANLVSFSRTFEGRRGVYPMANTDQASALEPALDMANADFAGAPIGEEDAYDYATTALALLRQITLGSSEVFNVYDALPALIQALGDERLDIVAQAASVIALIDTTEGQQAIADAALDVTRPTDLRIALLGSLADSATQIGSRLNEPQLDKVLDLVKTSDGDMALAAARAHGALTLPTSNIVEMLTK